MKPARDHLGKISIQCSDPLVKVGAINRLISNTTEIIVARGKNVNET